MGDIREVISTYRADLIKLAVLIFTLGAFYAQLPTRAGVEGIKRSLIELLDKQSEKINGQAREIEQVRRDLISRPTRAELKDILRTSENPWISVEPLVMQMVNNYDAERKATTESLLQIRVDLGIVKDALKRRANE